MDLRLFSPSQREIVQAGDGPLSVLAGPGSGKTTVLAGRIAYLVERRGVPPAAILAITFTTAAAATLRQRLAGVLGDVARDLTITTFHALGLRLIRQWSRELGFVHAAPAVFGREDTRSLMREVAAEFGLEVAAEVPGRPSDPWAVSLSRLSFAVDRYRLGSVQRSHGDGEYGDFDEELLRPLADAYEKLLRRRGAVDYPSMLTLPLQLFATEPRTLQVVQGAYRFALADEFQDTSRTQYALLQMLVEPHHNLTVVGDPKQCFIPGTSVHTPNGTAPIESLRAGDAVLAAAGCGSTASGAITSVVCNEFDGELVQVTLRSGAVLRLTPDHMCFARLGVRRDVFCLYLMYRRDLGYRIGITVGGIYAAEASGMVPGIKFRAALEHADKAWIIRVCSSLAEAAYYEQLISLRYGLPRVVFNAAGRQLILDQDALNRLYAAIDTRTNAAKLMADVGLHFEYPHHRPQGHIAEPRTHRFQVHVNLFSARNGSTASPWHRHRVWLNSSDKKTESYLQRGGLPTRAGAGRSWRIEREFVDIDRTISFATEIATTAEIPEIAWWARLSEDHKYSFQPASQLRETMLVPVLADERIVEDEIVAVDTVQYRGPVYDLNIKDLHNYVANTVVVHNCVFGWQGADPSLLLEFPRQYPEARVFPLDQNHRSTGIIVALSNAIAAPLKGGRESWTRNAQGPRARWCAAVDEYDEARFVAAEIHGLLDAGQIEHAGEVGVLYRTNAQARAVALALRTAALPFRVRADADLFGEPEVRDLVAYLRLAHCPSDSPALTRVVNAPPRRLRAIERALRKRLVPASELPTWAAKLGGPPARHRMEEFLVLLQDLHESTRESSPVQAFECVLLRTRYAEWLTAQKDSASRLRRIEDLRAVLADSPAPDLATWLTDMHLGHIDGPAPAGARSTVLSTIHSAKGAEWPVVFVIGLEDGLLPHTRPGSPGATPEQEEEERRLAYVAFSRAQVLLYLVYCRSRQLATDGGTGRIEPRRPSRFMLSLPPELVERVNTGRAA